MGSGQHNTKFYDTGLSAFLKEIHVCELIAFTAHGIPLKYFADIGLFLNDTGLFILIVLYISELHLSIGSSYSF